MDGWFKLHRKIVENPMFSDADLLRLWIMCLSKAAYKDTTVLIEKQEVDLKPGQFVTGRFSLYADYNSGVSPRKKVKDTTLWSWLKRLESYGNIDIKTTNKYSVVTVVKWSEYQDTLTTEPQQNDNKLTADCCQTDTNKKLRNEEVKEEKKNTSLEIENFRLRYSSEQLAHMDKYIDMIRHTRKSAKLADSVQASIYEYFDKFPTICVEHGIRQHYENPAHHTKKENYTYGIVRNTTAEEASAKLSNPSISGNRTSMQDTKKKNYQEHLMQLQRENENRHEY